MSDSATAPRKIRSILLIALLLMQLGLGWRWLGLGGVPQGLFEIRNARQISEYVFEDWPRLLAQWQEHKYYPPGFDTALAVVYALGLDDTHGLLLFNWLLLCLGCYGLVRLLDQDDGFLAAALFGLAPGIALNLHLASREFALACLLPPFLAMLRRSAGLSRRTPTLAAAALAAAGMYVKWTFCVFALAPGLAVLLLEAGRTRGSARARVVNGLCGAALLAALLAPWYAFTIDYSSLLFASSNDPSELSATEAATYYLRALVEEQLLWPAGLLCLLAVLPALIRRPRSAITLLLWIATPMAILSLLAHREARYIQPVVAACPALCALALGALRRFRRCYAAAAIALIALGLCGVWNDKFRHPVLLRDSGARVPISDLSCLRLDDQFVAWLDQTLPPLAAADAPARAVLHPMAMNEVLIGADAIGYHLSQQRRTARAPWSVDMLVHERLGEFVCNFPEYYLILVPDQLARTSTATQASMARTWAMEQDPRLQALFDGSDPALLRQIERTMQPRARFVSNCTLAEGSSLGITLYQRVAAAPEPPAICKQNLIMVPKTLY